MAQAKIAAVAAEQVGPISAARGFTAAANLLKPIALHSADFTL